jgi:hypothetical protein
VDLLWTLDACSEHIACPQPTSCTHPTSFSSIRRPSGRLKHFLEHHNVFSRMGRLDHAITALDVLGSVVQSVPVVGENLKSATEIAKKICEMAKVSVL